MFLIWHCFDTLGIKMPYCIYNLHPSYASKQIILAQINTQKYRAYFTLKEVVKGFWCASDLFNWWCQMKPLNNLLSIWAL